MTTPESDFTPLDAPETYNRRHGDADVVEICPQDNCPNLFILERRVNRHRVELNAHMVHIEELKSMVKSVAVQGEKNSADTAEILEIVTLAKSFFKVLGWIGDKLKPLIGLSIAISTVVGIIWASGAKWGGKP
jgi:hypothetical protein